MSSVVGANSAVFINYYNDPRDGTQYVYITNNTPGMLYCWIDAVDNRYDVSFYVNGYSNSALYFRPVHNFRWGCR